MNNSYHCLEFSKKVADDIFIIKVVFGSLGVLVSLFVFLLIGATKIYKQFVYRLVMYLMVVNALQALCQVLELIPIVVTDDDRITLRNGTAWLNLCSVFGYLEIVTAWNSNFVVIWTMLYLLALSWRIHRLLANPGHSSQDKSSHSSRSTSKYRELLCVILLLVSPFMFCWIPYFKNMYGPSGLWCWIQTINTTDESQCGNKSFQHWSLALMMIIFYGPIAAIMVFGLVCMVIIITLVWISSKQLHGGNRQKYRSSMKEIGFVLLYPVVHWIFCSFLLVNRIYSSVHTNANDLPPYYPLWIIHAIADPARIVIPALAFLLHPYAWKKIRSTCTYKSNRVNANAVSTDTNWFIPPEDDDISKGISIRPSAAAYGSIPIFSSIQ